MPTFAYAIPIISGKLEAWRRFLQEMTGSRRLEYEASRHRLGMFREVIWLVPSYNAGLIIWSHETATREEVWPKLAASAEPFDRWLKRQMFELHHLDAAEGVSPKRCEQVLVWQASLID